MILRGFRNIPTIIAACGFVSAPGLAAVSEEAQGKKACVVEARRLCPAEMKTMRRSVVEACMIAKIDQTSPVCHSAMLRIKAEREAADDRKAVPKH